MSHPKAEAFRADYARAEELVKAGRPDELLAVKQPLPFLATAAGFLAKYGPHDEYDVIRHLQQVDCPVRIILGTQTVAASPAFDGLPRAIEQLATADPHISLRLIENADINYANAPSAPFDDAVGWLATL